MYKDREKTHSHWGCYVGKIQYEQNLVYSYLMLKPQNLHIPCHQVSLYRERGASASKWHKFECSSTCLDMEPAEIKLQF